MSRQKKLVTMRRIDAALYAAATGVNRGGFLFLFPLVTSGYGIEMFGIWSLGLICANILGPLLTVNSSSAILRDGRDVELGVSILRISLMLTLAFYSVGYCLSNIPSLVPNWLSFGVQLGVAEAFIYIVLNLLRALDYSGFYALISILKFLVQLVVVASSVYMGHEFDDLLLLYTLTSLIFGLVVGARFIFSTRMGLALKTKSSFVFSAGLIPHSLAQWGISGANRVILSAISGAAAVGYYSVSFNLAALLFLVNSGLSIILPTPLINNYDEWLLGGKDEIYLGYYFKIAMLFTLVSFLLYVLDFHYFGLLVAYGVEIILSFVFVSIGFFALGIYYFYANYLFYHRRSFDISKVTLRASLLSVVLTVLIVYFFGYVGAAFSLMLVYLFYLLDVERVVVASIDGVRIKYKGKLIFYSLSTVIFGVVAWYATRA